VKDREQKTGDRGQNGSAIIITVLIVTILVALVVEFAYEVNIDTAALSNWTNAQKASLIAKSGQTICSNYIKMIKSDNILSEIEFPVERDLGSNTQLIIKIEDENAKFNINGILNKGSSSQNPLNNLQKLFEYLNINTKLALVIADWIDPDIEPREGLSDSENNAKNAYLQSVDELKLIPGIDKVVFETIKPYLTVYGYSSTTDITININTVKLPVLVSFKDMTETLAKRIIDYREITPFKSPSVSDVGIGSPGISLAGYIQPATSNYRITSSATVNEITRVIESVVDKYKRIQFWREQ
jgi:type II secretory pathway component PulK